MAQVERSATTPAWAVVRGPAKATGNDERGLRARTGTTGIEWARVYESWRRNANNRLRPATFVLYDSYVRRTFRGIGKRFLDDIDFMDLESALLEWQADFEDRRGRPLRRGTVANCIAALVDFYDYAIDKADLPIRNVARKLDRPRTEDIEREVVRHEPIPRDTFARIVAMAVRHEDFRWALAARFLWTTVGRIGDAGRLRWPDVDFERKQVVILQPKRGRPIRKALYDDLLEDLRWWRESVRAGPDDYVFRRKSQTAKRFRHWFAYRLRKYAKAVGHRGYVHPHLIRASAATALNEAGVPRPSIMFQGGWASETQLRKYLRDDPEAHRPRLQEVLDL